MLSVSKRHILSTVLNLKRQCWPLQASSTINFILLCKCLVAWCNYMVQLYGGIHLSFRPTKVLDMEVVEFSFFFSILGARGASWWTRGTNREFELITSPSCEGHHHHHHHHHLMRVTITIPGESRRMFWWYWGWDLKTMKVLHLTCHFLRAAMMATMYKHVQLCTLYSHGHP